ncbi:MAG: biotin/lipoyl-containing protein, partial [Clostridium sp.]|nr:biotin/lipoyl-containing protein [Clostridium sp.]
IDKNYIKSNLAGTFYLKKEENSEPFVGLNEKINENTVVGLVEVMKLFNEVEAGVSGEIIDILVDDGEFVEYGQQLFEIKIS